MEAEEPVIIEETVRTTADTGLPPKPPAKPKRKYPKRAEVWRHFIQRHEDDKEAHCRYCGTPIGCDSVTAGTSSMNGHIKICKLYKDFNDRETQKALGTDNHGNMRVIKYDPQLFRKCVNELVVVNELPFSFVESEGWKRFCSNIVPLYQTFSRRTSSKDIAGMYLQEKSELKHLFGVEKQRVSLTTDIWVCQNTSVNYMVVTAHWIDENWVMQKRILSFKVVTDHKGDTIAGHLLDCLDEWGIEKVFTVTVDNAKGNDKALRVFREELMLRGGEALVRNGEFMHMRCCAHILNLIVGDGLKRANHSIVCIRNAIKYVRSSFTRLKSFQLRCDTGKVCRGSLPLDVVTRWNSTYLMLTSALKLRVAFEKMLSEDRLYDDYFKEEDEKTKLKRVRRFFDIYIQRKLEVKDFNIAEEAKGVGNVVVKTFPVEIRDGKLEIQLYWAGKGTTVIPKDDVYGPLISAISVDPNFNPPPRKGMSGTLHAVVVIANILIVSLVLGLLWKRGCLRSKSQMERDFKSLELMITSFSLRQIKIATNNFDSANRIGEGGFGPVYKGKLSDGTIIAVKKLSTGSKQGNREFLNEIGMISALHHPNLVKLYGCCVEGDQLLLVYEFVENNSLAQALFGPQETQVRLDWPTRRKICIGVARGLAYLHEESRLKIVHRDIKATNVLLDKELNSKISDFGLAKLDEEDNTHMSTRVAGTFGYMAPEYAMRGHLTDKADVYSFGIVALEIVHGRSNKIERYENNSFYLIDWVEVLREQNNLLELVDPRLGSDYNREEAMTMIQIAIMCTSSDPRDRPSMSEVVKMLEGKKMVEMEKLEEASIHRETKRLENMNTMKKYYEMIGQEVSTSMSMTMSDQSKSSSDH